MTKAENTLRAHTSVLCNMLPGAKVKELQIIVSVLRPHVPGMGILCAVSEHVATVGGAPIQFDEGANKCTVSKSGTGILCQHLANF